MEFLRYVVNDLYDKFGGQLENITIVLPTRRAGLFVKKYLADLVNGKPVCAPECTTLSDLFDSLCSLKPVDEIKAICLLYDIYKEKTKDIFPENKALTLDHFYSWGRQLIADFNNVDKNYIDSFGEDIFKSSAEAHEFDKDNLDLEVKERIKNLIRGQIKETYDGSAEGENEESFKKTFELVWQELPNIYRELTTKLENENCALEGSRNKWVVHNFETVWQSISDTTFVFAGFNILVGTERRFMHLVDDKEKALFYWDYDSTFDEAEPFVPAYHNVKQNLKEFGGSYEPSKTNLTTIDIASATSDNAQARYVHSWLQAHHADGQTSAVILCNEMMLHPVAFSVPKSLSGKVNITKGFPMKHTQIFARISAWLKNPANTGGGIAEILLKLRDFIDKEWDNYCSGKKAKAGSQTGNGSQTATDTQVVEDRQTNTYTQRDTDSQTSMAWYEMLNRESVYQARCVVVRFISLANEGVLAEINEAYTLRNILLTHLGMVSIPFHGEPITDVQIMGVLETRTLDFDNVLLLNVEEGVVPQSGHDNSFIPYYLRKYYKLTTLEDQAQVYSYNFLRILRRARNVTLLYSEAQTSSGQKTMSRFVMQILTSGTLGKYVKRYKLNCVFAQQDAPDTVKDDVPSLQDNEMKQVAQFPTYRAKLLDSKKKNPQRDIKLSPSAINTYLKCKRRFFMKYMLDLKEPDNNNNLLQANELGTLIHESIRASYKLITNGSGVGLIAPESIKAFVSNPLCIDRAVTMAYESMNRDHYERNHKQTSATDATDSENILEFYVQQDHPVETTVAKKHLINVLTNDSKQTYLCIIGNELKKYARLDIPGFGELLIGGSIDRLDTVVEGGSQVVRIVDYKTGNYDKNKMKAKELDDLFQANSEQGYVLQTLIYSMACLEDAELAQRFGGLNVKPQLLFTQKKLSNFDSDLFIGSSVINDVRSIQEEFKQRLVELVIQILDEENFEQVTDTPTNGIGNACRYCPFILLCGK